MAPAPSVYNYTWLDGLQFVGKKSRKSPLENILFLIDNYHSFISPVHTVYYVAPLVLIIVLLVLECDGPVMVIPDDNITGVEEFVLTTKTMLVTLASGIDYEVATDYTLVIEIVDMVASPPLTGEATLKVGLYIFII